MKGMIKFYNKDKGFGFVVGENNQDYYFNQKVIPFGHIPTSGDMIEFEVSDKPTSNKHKEPTIAKMTMTGEQAAGMNNTNNDNRVECPHCHKRIMPRLVTYAGRADRSLCPLCGSVIAEFVQENHPLKISKWVLAFIVFALVIAMFLTGTSGVGSLIPMLLIFLGIAYWSVNKPWAKNKIKVKN
ncbi:MAG: hypothetical protein IJ187_00340 [Neisseriaceae bacterium]|nr:hypothetical protein [Neisseriaceae bacterium]MBQ9724321.1 hypothetical protein [Neisseriaceae bacterium]